MHVKVQNKTENKTWGYTAMQNKCQNCTWGECIKKKLMLLL